MCFFLNLYVTRGSTQQEDIPCSRLATRCQKRRDTYHSSSGESEEETTCCICLEPLGPAKQYGRQVTGFPCNHRFHAICMWSILNASCLGAKSMMQCPLCRDQGSFWQGKKRKSARGTLDRYDMWSMGYPVNPQRLRLIAAACIDWRTMLDRTQPFSPSVIHPSVLARQVTRCARLTPFDGFVYNSCILALDRMIAHKVAMARSLAMQYHSLCPASADLADFVQQRLVVHLDVLLHSASAVVG